jgi:autotransporter-associated beta strand protein
LTGANTYAGATTVSAGVLKISNASALGTVAGGTTVASGAALQINNQITTLAEPLTLNGTGVANDGALRSIPGPNTFAGPITLASASRINSDSGTLTLSNTIAATNLGLTLGGAGNITASGIIGLGSGGLTKDGSGLLVLSGANSFTGATTVSAGVLKIGNASALGTVAGGTTVASGAALQIYNNITTLAEPLTLSGTGIANDGALRNIADTNTFSGPISLGAASRIACDSGTLTLNTINGPTFGLTLGGAGSITANGIIGLGSGGLTKDGSGLLVLSGANTYTGATTVKAGLLRATSGTGLPTASNLILSGGILEGIGATTFTRNLGTTGTNTIQWTGTGGFSASGGKMTVAIGGTASPTALTWASGSFVPSAAALVFGSTAPDNETEFRNNINLAGAAQTVTVNDNPATAADFATLSGVLSNGGLSKDGSGMLVLSGANTYTGATTVKAGALRAAEGTGLPATSSLVLAGGIFEGLGATTVTRSLGTSAGNTVQWTGSSGFSASGGKMTVAIGGTGSPTALTWASGSFVPSGSALMFGSTTADNATEFRNNINLAGAARTVTVNDNPATAADFATLSGVLSNGSLVKDGIGMLVVSGANTYAGTTTVKAGALRATSGAGLPTASNLILNGGVLEGPGATTFTRSLGTSGTNTVQWTGSGGFSAYGGKMTVAIGGTASPTALTWGSGNFVPPGFALLLGSLAADSETEFTNPLGFAGAARTVLVSDNPFSAGDFATISGTLSNGGLIKDGPGMLVLKGSHTYTGATTVAASTLKLAAGAVLASTTFDVGSGATLDLRDLVGGLTLGSGKSLKGGGTILGDLVVGGTLSPGESPGILSVEDITFAAGSILNMELGGTVRGSGYDALVSSGDVVLQDGSTLSVSLISSFVPEKGDEFDVLDFSSLSGQFTTINLPALADGLTWSTDGLYLDGTIGITPEPATLALLALGGLGMLLRRRRK